MNVFESRVIWSSDIMFNLPSFMKQCLRTVTESGMERTLSLLKESSENIHRLERDCPEAKSTDCSPRGSNRCDSQVLNSL